MMQTRLLTKNLTALALAISVFDVVPCRANSSGAEVTVETKTPDGLVESCFLPRHYFPYEDSASDRKDEIKLCRLSSYAPQEAKLEFAKNSSVDPKLFKKVETKEVVLCPKLNSTVPGTDFVDLPKDWNQAKAQKEFCLAKLSIPLSIKDKYSIEARLKSWFADASTSSVLAYYHFSRLLNVGRVPPAVLRTVQRTTHAMVVDKANDLLKGSDDHIARNWKALSTANQNAARGKVNPNVYTSDGKYLYGALSVNSKGEEKYTEVSGVGDFLTRYQRFTEQAPFLKVASDLPIPSLIGSNRIEKLGPAIVQMRDVSGMILIDSLLAQDDRIGNIHYKIEIIENTPTGAVLRELSKTEKEAARTILDKARESLLAKARNAEASGNLHLIESLRGQAEKIKLTERMVLQALKTLYPNEPKIVAKVMILKDNDCGTDVNRRKNQMRKIGALERIRHMDPEVYRRFIKLADEILSDRFKPFAMNTLLYRENDYQNSPVSLKENTKYALSVLQANCRSGALRLDLTMNFDSKGEWVPQSPPSCL